MCLQISTHQIQLNHWQARGRLPVIGCRKNSQVAPAPRNFPILQGVPKKCTFKILRAMMGGRNFGPLWAIQVLSEGLGHFGSLWAHFFILY